jgi:hypothetical protein
MVSAAVIPQATTKTQVVNKLTPLLILLLAFGLQTAYLAELRAMFPGSFASEPFCGVDAKAHLARSVELLDGSLPGKEPYVFIPLYPFYLAFLKAWLGDSILLAVLLQLLLQVVGIAALYGIGRLVFSPLTGALATLGLATYNYYHYYMPCYDQTLLTTPFFSLTVFFLLRFHQRGRLAWLLLAGVMLALAVLSRPTLLVIFPVVAVWFVWVGYSLRQTTKNMVLLILPFIILVWPITWHNYQVSGRFILISDNFGVNLFTGNNPDAQGLDSLAESQSQPAVLRYIEIYKLVEAGETTLPAEVWRYIREQPYDWLALMLKKTWLWFAEIDERLLSPFFPLMVSQSRTLAYLPVEWQATLVVAIVGIVLASGTAISKERVVLLWLIYGILSVATIIFFIDLRFRLPFAPFIMLSAAAPLAVAPEWGRNRPRRFWLTLAILLLLYPLVPALWFYILLFVGLELLRGGRVWQVESNSRRQTTVHYSSLALVCLYLLAVGWWVYANRLATDVSQAIDHYLGPPLVGAGILGQTFQMDCNGLNHLQVTLGVRREQHDQPVIFYLARDLSSHEILFSETFDGATVQDYQKKKFFFEPISDSAGQTFFFFLASPTSTPQNNLTARGYTDTPVDRYPAGQAWAGQRGAPQPLQADFAFEAGCDLSGWQKAQMVLAQFRSDE